MFETFVHSGGNNDSHTELKRERERETNTKHNIINMLHSKKLGLGHVTDS